MAGLSVISLRRRMPQQERPYLIKGGYLIPAVTALVFSLLAVAVLASDLSALLYMAVAFVIVLVYVKTVVPRVKKKYEASKPAARRRPVRSQEGAEGK
jgi:amino acid transporter